ncbi:hypothetical protein [Rhodococcoides fascians]|uniref:hypothetical protein n=1 Tax=Rhodococcoides fascians TaxID=1828 RepID=UPI000564575F|nr:hypothetical protein [Rhodococcus fascians]
MNGSSLAIEEHCIRITGGLDDDARPSVACKFVVAGTDSELIPYYDGLAMLEVAKQDFIRRHRIHETQENNCD